MTRKEKYSRSSRTRSQQKNERQILAEDGMQDVDNLPPRRKKFPSSKYKVTKWYYNFLFVLFVALVVGLFWYGNTYYPSE